MGLVLGSGMRALRGTPSPSTDVLECMTHPGNRVWGLGSWVWES